MTEIEKLKLEQSNCSSFGRLWWEWEVDILLAQLKARSKEIACANCHCECCQNEYAWLEKTIESHEEA